MGEQPSLFSAELHHGDFGRFRVDHADAVAWLRGLPPESVDLIVTDPAYESLEKHRAVGTTTRLQSWFDIFPNARFPELFAAAFRALRRDAHLYLICDQETMFVVKPMGEAAGFTFWKPLIWDKQTIGMGYHYRSRYEVVLFFEKGERKLNDLGMADVIAAKRVRDGYPTEKPVELLRPLIEQSTRPGEVVADCFTGSGSCGEAALRAERRFLGCDVSSETARNASTRLQRVAEELAP